jgi:hypothetical protein
MKEIEENDGFPPTALTSAEEEKKKEKKKKKKRKKEKCAEEEKKKMLDDEDQRGAHIRLEPEVNLQSGASLAKYERFHGCYIANLIAHDF